jgi:D-tagatose-1,6-bisphosphate aldolase subunit GatZ/KbaZ
VRALVELVERHRAGAGVGIPSVCSAHPLVLRATLAQALERGGFALIEATSNQVNQDGGYTGMRPAAFRDLVHSLAEETGLPRERVLLGGDHLGPNPWQSARADEALARADRMVAEYVQTGFRKIHLDCSMACAGDPPVLDPGVIAARAAALCASAEAAWRAVGGEPPAYVIGTEVPVPGGAHESLGELAVTAPAAALATVDAHREAFMSLGLADAWQRVIGLVVQPGVEFDNDRVADYAPARARSLSEVINRMPRLVYEAHSTDYQTPAALAALVRDHFAILKVGPAATFALREALWALEALALEWLGSAAGVPLRATVLAAMRADPRHWQRYYHGSGRALELALEFGLSDRIRYYWPVGPVAAAVERLLATLDDRPPPPALLSQYLPSAYRALRARGAPLRARDCVIAHVRELLDGYWQACVPGAGA